MYLFRKTLQNRIAILFITLNRLLFKFKSIDVIVILFITLFAYLNGLADHSTQSLVAHDEALYSSRAKLILQNNDWFTPFDSVHHKTIGSYWITAFSFKLFGINDFAARLPSAIFSSLSSVLVYYISISVFNRRTSFISALFLPAMPLWLNYSRYSSPDITFVFLVLSIFYLFLKYQLQDNRQSFGLFYLLIGIFISITFFLRSFMVVLPLLSFIPLSFNINFSFTRRHIVYLLLGFSIGLTPTLIYLIKSSILYGKESFFLLFDFAQKQAAGSAIFSGFTFYPLNILALSFPIGLLSIIGFIRLLINKENGIYRLFIFFPSSVFIILLFTSSNYSHYSLILYPFIAIYSSYAIDFSYYKKSLFPRLIGLFSSLSLLIFGLSVFLYSKYFFQFYPINSLVLEPDIYLKVSNIGFIYIFISALILLSNSRIFPYLFFFGTQIQIIILSNLFALGLLGNPNKDIKIFLNINSVSNIIYNHRILLYDVEGKIDTLLRYYIPNTKKISTLPEIYSKRTFLIIDSSKIDQIMILPNPSRKISTIRNYQLWQVDSYNKL